MSKGIGLSYITRMRRWHVPWKGNKIPIDVIADRSYYSDGQFKYKLPRFYRDRLYRKKFPCDAQIWNQKKNCYEKKIIWRYKSKNILALSLQAEIRSRLLAEYNRKVADLSSQFPDKSRLEIDIEITRSETAARLFRQKDIYTKMSGFYNYQRFKNRKF